MSNGNRFPIVTNLPGLSVVFRRVDIIQGFIGRAEFLTKSKRNLTIEHSIGADALTVYADDGSIATFKPWPGDPPASSPPAFPGFYSATGIQVVTTREGTASALYAYARLFLGGCRAAIAPSENVLPDGVALWAKFDPSIRWEPGTKPTAVRPNLSGRSPPVP